MTNSLKLLKTKLILGSALLLGFVLLVVYSLCVFQAVFLNAGGKGRLAVAISLAFIFVFAYATATLFARVISYAYPVEKSSLWVFFTGFLRMGSGYIDRIGEFAYTCITALVSSIYTFSSIYALLYSCDNSQFSQNCFKSPFDVLYFSVITTATVGYGDIYPVKPLARSIVSIQVLLSMLYVIMVLSTITQISNTGPKVENEPDA